MRVVDQTRGGTRLTSTGESLEYIGDKYSKELLSKSLLEKVENNLYLKRIRLHDLMHDLAKKVAATASEYTSQAIYHNLLGVKTQTF